VICSSMSRFDLKVPTPISMVTPSEISRCSTLTTSEGFQIEDFRLPIESQRQRLWVKRVVGQVNYPTLPENREGWGTQKIKFARYGTLMVLDVFATAPS
jgi:hypothetical protein